MKPRRGWRDMETAPKDERILIVSEAGIVYVANWVIHPVTDHEAWLIAQSPDGMQMLCDCAVGWHPLPNFLNSGVSKERKHTGDTKK